MSASSGEHGIRTHQTLGVDIASEFRFRTPLLHGSKPSIHFTRGAEVRVPGDAGYSLAYSSRLTDAEGRSVFELWAQERRQLLRFVDRADFELEPGSVRYSASGDHADFDVENLFLSAVLAYMLEVDGVIALHASAVEVAGAAVAFLAPSGGGKSTLAAALVKRGYRLVTDDVLALEVGVDGACVRPAYPQLKLNPDVGGVLLGESFSRLRRFDPRAEKRCWSPTADGHAFCTQRTKLGLVYVLESRRKTGEGMARSMSRRDGLTRLLSAGFTPALVEAVGLAESRLHCLSSIVRRTPVRLLSVAGGIGDLEASTEAVVRDISNL